MSQFDFGVIDPYVVDGVQLADDLNQFRDALLSYHRGGARPAYVVPGMLWINDAGGPTNWILNVYLSPTIGDRALFNYDTTTGNITVAAGATGTVNAAVLLAQAAASPSVRWNSTANPIDAKAWRMTVDAAGALVLSSYSDAGVLQNSITFGRDGSIASPVPMWRRLARIIPTATQFVDYTAAPADINDLMFHFDVTPGTNAQLLVFQFFDNAGVIDNNATHYAYSLSATNNTQTAASSPGTYSSAASGIGNGIALLGGVTGALVGTASGIRGRGFIPDIRNTTRNKSVGYQGDFVGDNGTALVSVTGGSGWRNFVGAITGFRLVWGGGNFAAGGAVTVWGSP